MGQSALKGYLGRKSHVAQLNAAGKHMAAMHGWEVRATHPCWSRGLIGFSSKAPQASAHKVLEPTRYHACPLRPRSEHPAERDVLVKSFIGIWHVCCPAPNSPLLGPKQPAAAKA